MKTQYTKGDWKICSNMAKDKRAKCFWYDIEDINRNTIAEVKGIHYGIRNNTAEANAKLIAAAPITIEELYKTNEYLKSLIKNDCIKGIGTIETIKGIIRANEQAIKKATE